MVKVGIITSENTCDYHIEEIKDSSNDELCRAITYLEIAKLDLLEALDSSDRYDYSVEKEDEEDENLEG